MLSSAYRRALLHFILKRLPALLTDSFYGKVPEPGQIKRNCEAVKPLLEKGFDLALERFKTLPQKFSIHLVINTFAIMVLTLCKVIGVPAMLSTTIACLAGLSSIGVVFLSVIKLQSIVTAYIDEANPTRIIHTQMLALVAQVGLLQMAFCAGIGLSLVNLMVTSFALLFPMALAMQYFMIPNLVDAIIAQPLSVKQAQAFISATEDMYSDATLESIFMNDLEGSSISAIGLIHQQYRTAH
jgi:hypothetical protein